MSKIEHITTEAAVDTYENTREIFDALFEDIEELSKKKPDLQLTVAKVNNLNRVLRKLMTILKEEPQGEFLDELNDQPLPQASDARMFMRSFQVALDAFCERYESDDGWMTPELVAELEAEGIEHEDEGSGDEPGAGEDDEDDEDDEDEDDRDRGTAIPDDLRNALFEGMMGYNRYAKWRRDPRKLS